MEVVNEETGQEDYEKTQEEKEEWEKVEPQASNTVSQTALRNQVV